MKSELADLLKAIFQEMGIPGVDVEVEIPENPSHGDYYTSVALKLSKILKKPPMDIALEVVEKLKAQNSKLKSERPNQNITQHEQNLSTKLAPYSILQDISTIKAVPPGFINFYISEAKLSSQLERVINEREGYGKVSSVKRQASSRKKNMIPDTLIPDAGAKRIMVEFAHPNTHKAFHIGHLRNITTGESIVRLLEASGKEIVRANYQGDVGMHIAKALYALLHISTIKSQISKTREQDLGSKVDFLGKAYAAGNKAFEENTAAKAQTGEINKKIYAKDASIYSLYQETRQWSLDYFNAIYKRVGSHFDRLYFESEVYESGKKTVLEGLKKGVFEESEGAIIFPGEKFGFHNRVFITGEGNATYEGKDMGLGPLQFAEYHPDRIIHVVGPEQAGYFQVIFEALAQLFPETRGKEYHLVYGWVKLKHGKMSSRSGNVVLGEWLLDEAKKEIYNILQKSKSDYKKEQQDEIAEKAAVAAVKYSFLKVSTEREIAFDLAESVNFEGDSGPYLQYTYARCKSVLRKAGPPAGEAGDTKGFTDETRELLNISNAITYAEEEREVARLIMYFPEVVADAGATLSPSTLCSYLFTLAQAFNLFYAKHSILGIAKEDSKAGKAGNSRNTSNARILRLSLTAATAQVLKNGLYLLGIETLEKM